MARKISGLPRYEDVDGEDAPIFRYLERYQDEQKAKTVSPNQDAIMKFFN